MRFVLLMCTAHPATPFVFFAAGSSRMRRTAGVVAKASGQAEPVVAVIGRRDGTAAALAHTLGCSPAGVTVRAVFHSSGSLAAVLPAKVEVGPVVDLGTSCDPKLLASAWEGAQALVVACDGAGPSGTGASEEFLHSLEQGLEESERSGGVQSVVCVAPGTGFPSFVEAPEKDSDKYDGLLSGAALGESFSMPKLPSVGNLRSLLRGGGGGGYARVVAAARSGGARVVLVRHGRVFGGTPGAKPPAFTTGPRKEPELDEHYAARAVVLSSTSEALSAEARTGRDALASLVTQLVKAPLGPTDPEKVPARAVREMTLVSVDGPEPTNADWASQLSRMAEKAGGAGVELLRVAFEAVPRPYALVSWLELDWATIVLGTMSTRGATTGARPVSALPCALPGVNRSTDPLRQLGGCVRVTWEDVGEDMSPLMVGGLIVSLAPEEPEEGAQLGTSPWALVVTRERPENGRSLSNLPGENELVQRLLEGLEVAVYGKGLALRPGTTATPTGVSPEEAAAAR
jgi:hypothetical protein